MHKSIKKMVFELISLFHGKTQNQFMNPKCSLNDVVTSIEYSRLKLMDQFGNIFSFTHFFNYFFNTITHVTTNKQKFTKINSYFNIKKSIVV